MADAGVVAWFVVQAVRAFGDRVLALEGQDGAAGAQAVGRDLVRLLFGGSGTASGVPAPLAAMISYSDRAESWVALESHVEELLDADPGLAAAASDLLNGYYRVLDSGDGPALVELGEAFWHNDPDLAREALERAVDAGHEPALIDLARHRCIVSGDYDGALLLLERAIGSPDPDVSAGALARLGETYLAHGEYGLARTAFDRCIANGHRDWGPQAMLMLAGLLIYQIGDRDAARDMLNAAVGTGHPVHARAALSGLGHLLHQAGDDQGAIAAYRRLADMAPPGSRGDGLCDLADLLEETGDADGARAAWQQVIDTEPGSDAAERALIGLLNLLGRQRDLDGLRAALDTGTAACIPGAAYAHVVIGNVLRERGDADGWRRAWQRAIDAGYDDDGSLQDELAPPPEEDPGGEPSAMPPGFDPRNMARTAVAVLETGLPPLPDDLNHHMAIPLACWTAGDTGVVLFLHFVRHRRGWYPAAIPVTLTRRDGQWTAPAGYRAGTSFHDPFTDPGDLRGLDGRPIAVSGGSHGAGTAICYGTAATAVTHIALIQDGQEDRRPLQNHFGAWIIITSQPGPFTVAAISANGTTLGEISFDPPEHPDVPPPPPREHRAG
ncbi:MAG: tetratricopeptide repeat protein [Streptosporangiaceae bacterium]